MDAKVAMRLLVKIAPQPDGHWLWTGALDLDGYGRFKLAGRNLKAHPLVYELLVGPVPDGLELDHRPDCPRSCCCPDHLEPVTHRENVLRGNGPPAQNARKTHCTSGHPLSGDNLIIRSNGGRRCRTCQRRYQQRQDASRRSARRHRSVAPSAA